MPTKKPNTFVSGRLFHRFINSLLIADHSTTICFALLLTPSPAIFHSENSNVVQSDNLRQNAACLLALLGGFDFPHIHCSAALRVLRSYGPRKYDLKLFRRCDNLNLLNCFLLRCNIRGQVFVNRYCQL